MDNLYSSEDVLKLFRTVEKRIDKLQCFVEECCSKIPINIGNGVSLFKRFYRNKWEFKTILAGDNVTITEQDDTITINSSGGGSSFNCNDLNQCSTTNLPEGLNLYFTTNRAIQALQGENISIFTNNVGYLTSITSLDVTNALGFTPYNSTNPSGYITSSALSPYLTISSAALIYQPIGSYLTTIAGLNISQLTNDSGYITSSALSPYLTSATAASTYQLLGTYATESNSMTFSNKSGNISQWTNDSAYITSTGAKTAIGHYVVGKTFTGTTVSSSVAETLVMSLLTSANTFQQYDIPEIYFSGKKGGAFTSTATLRLYINTSNSISGATLIGTLSLQSTTRTSNIQRINGCFTTSTNYNVMSATTSSASDSTTIAANESSITWDTTQAYYVIASIQLGSTGDTFTPTYLLIKNNR